MRSPNSGAHLPSLHSVQMFPPPSRVWYLPGYVWPALEVPGANHMRRRNFLAVLGGAATGWLPPVITQTQSKVYHLGSIAPLVPMH